MDACNGYCGVALGIWGYGILLILLYSFNLFNQDSIVLRFVGQLKFVSVSSDYGLVTLVSVSIDHAHGILLSINIPQGHQKTLVLNELTSVGLEFYLDIEDCYIMLKSLRTTPFIIAQFIKIYFPSRCSKNSLHFHLLKLCCYSGLSFRWHGTE